MLRSDECNFSGADIAVKGTITVTNQDNNEYDKNQLLKTMHHLFLAFQNLIIHPLTMQKTQIL